MDLIPTSWDTIQPSPATCLILPLNAIWYASAESTSFRQPGFKNLLVGDLFVLEENENYSLRLRTSADGCHYPIRLSRFRSYLTQNQLQLHPYFACLSDHTQVTHIHTHTSPRLQDTSTLLSSFVQVMDGKMWRPKAYRKFIAPDIPSDNSSVSWTTFWHTPMHHTARNVWFRLLHDRIPTSSRVHHYAPDFVTSPLCRICSTTNDDDFHFLMGWPKKGEVGIKSGDPFILRILISHRFFNVFVLPIFRVQLNNNVNKRVSVHAFSKPYGPPIGLPSSATPLLSPQLWLHMPAIYIRLYQYN